MKRNWKKVDRVNLVKVENEEDGSVICPVCGSQMKLKRRTSVIGTRKRVRSFAMVCEVCDAGMECKANGNVSAKPADAWTRYHRHLAHQKFDKLWADFQQMPDVSARLMATKRNKQRTVRRTLSTQRRRAYLWLSIQLGIPTSECHFGYFNIAQCKNVIAICEGVRLEDIRAWWKTMKGTQPNAIS